MRVQLAFVLALLIGCRESRPPATSPAAEGVFHTLGSLRLASIDEAYARLDDLEYTAVFTLTELNEDANEVAALSQSVRHGIDGRPAMILNREISGAFSDAKQQDQLTARNPLAAILPDEPAFLSARTRDHYSYEARADTIVAGISLHVLSAELRGSSNEMHPIRSVRYFLDDENAIQGLDVSRVVESALFSENSRSVVWLTPSRDGTLIPSHASTETVVQTAGHPTVHLRMTHQISIADINE